MENVALWGLIVSVTLASLCNVIIQSSPDPELQRVAAAAAKRRGTPFRRALLVATVLGLINAPLYILVALGTGDWRWAALYLVPFAASWLGRAANAKKKEED